MDATTTLVDTARIAAAPPPPDPAALERRARLWFAAVERRAFGDLVELVHPDMRLVSRIQPGLVVEGRADVVRFIEEKVSDRLYEAVADVYTPIDDQRIAVEGRMRWIDDDRVIRDDPVVWAMEFRDGLLLRFIPARTLHEAESLLATDR